MPRAKGQEAEIPLSIANSSVGLRLAYEGAPASRSIQKVVLRRSSVKARKGDTIASIAARYGLSPATVARWNQAKPGQKLAPGKAMVLHLPQEANGGNGGRNGRSNATAIANAARRGRAQAAAEKADTGKKASATQKSGKGAKGTKGASSNADKKGRAVASKSADKGGAQRAGKEAASSKTRSSASSGASGKAAAAKAGSPKAGAAKPATKKKK